MKVPLTSCVHIACVGERSMAIIPRNKPNYYRYDRSAGEGINRLGPVFYFTTRVFTSDSVASISISETSA